MSRRSRIEQTVSALQYLKENPNSIVTRLYYGANINPTIAKRVLTQLIEKSFITKTGKRYNLTAYGKTWLSTYTDILKSLKGVNE